MILQKSAKVPKIRKFYLSSRIFTVQVNVNEGGTIVWTAPVARKFIGQPFSNLIRWSRADKVVQISTLESV